MSFVRDLEEIKKRQLERETADFGSAEMVNVFWLTKSEIIKRILPPPLKPPKIPLAHAFVANYPKTNFGLPYLESALFVRTVFGGNEGNYCLAMHLDGPGKDLAMAGGREHFGFPKKLASIQFNFNENKFEGWSERHDIRNIEIHAKFVGKMNDKESPKILVDSGMLPGKMKNVDN